MTPEERHDTESRAERALRRGEWGLALSLLREVARARPDDTALAARIAEFEGHLSPAEQARRPPLLAEPSGVFRSPMHEAEALAARDDFAGAIAQYRRLLAENPDLDLVKERLAELFQLAQASAAPRNHPASREQVLEHLLGRISSRRRG